MRTMIEPEGISVTEIRLGLANTHYYLYWDPAFPPHCPADRRALLGAVRETCRQLGWKILAVGTGTGRVRLVFQTSAGNLEHGLTALVQDARTHRVYMVQPVAALPFIARYVHESKDAGHRTSPAHNTAPPPELPAVHYGMFMGERAWAEQMLDLLTRCAVDAASRSHRLLSLTEIAGSHSSSHDAIAAAYRSGRFSLKDIAEHFDMHFSEVSAVINAAAE